MTTIRTKETAMGVVIFILIITAWAMFHVWTRTNAIETGYAISRQQEIHEQLESDNKALKLEISTLKSSKRLVVIAEKQLGMHAPTPDQVVYLWENE